MYTHQSHCFSLLAIYILSLLGLSIQPLYAASQCRLKQIKSGDSIALVIANSQYEKGRPLKQPINDAIAMRKVLEKLGFKVIFKTELERSSMNRATVNFSQCLQMSQGVGLFYFTGYGMQLKEKNYLLPTNIKIEDKYDVEFDAFPVNKLVGRLKEVNNELNIIILDASRENPYPSFGHRGLANTSSPMGFIVAFPAEKGKTIPNDPKWGINSLYIKHLIKALETAKQKPQRVEEVFMQVADAVVQESGGLQEPTQYVSLKKPYSWGVAECQARHQTQPPAYQARHQAQSSHDMTNQAQKQLYQMAKAIKGLFNMLGLENSLIRIEGYTDNRGNAEFNKWLSLKRAQNVKKHLVEDFNFPADRLEAVGCGAQNPIATNETEGGRFKNRYIELIILDK
jgi:outer membrane protein OmpA-like peptidoglycan-associated protein